MVFKKPDDVVNLPVDIFGHDNEPVSIFRDILKFVPDTFPIRILDKIYIVQLNTEENVRGIINWYQAQCKTTRKIPSKRIVHTVNFLSSMRRRLYYLSIICDTRMDMENMITDNNFAMRCGYDGGHSYRYVTSMI